MQENSIRLVCNHFVSMVAYFHAKDSIHPIFSNHTGSLMNAKSILKSFLVGLAVAIGIGMLAFALAFDAFKIYIAPAGWLLRVVFPIIAPAVNWIIPEGGPPAGVLAILVCSVMFWTTLLAIIHFSWTRYQKRHRPS